MNKEPIHYLKIASSHAGLKESDFSSLLRINLVTNFTDDVLVGLLKGVALDNGVYPVIYKVPYRQYALALKGRGSELYEKAMDAASTADATVIFFNLDPFKESEFRSSREHFQETLLDIESYAKAISGTVIVNTFIVSYQGVYGNLFESDPFFALVREYNAALADLAARLPNLFIFDTNRLVHLLGERHTFDLRGLYAFDLPFTHEFMAFLAEEWFTVIRGLKQAGKKCIVLDLDNTLWGGVVGEVGPLGVALGPDYPGNAFVNFQRALLDFYNRGIILTINSKNNLEDVMEVFEKNPHMILKEKHFAAIRANWDDKAENILDIANELNIGTDSMVFIDDDPLHRAMVAGRLPEVAVPDFSLPPEEYASRLYAMPFFHQSALTEEDKEKGKMYGDERQRKKVQASAKSAADYIADLAISVDISVNNEALMPRLAQLTQKTNQYNLTTRRYSEQGLRAMIQDGALAYAGTVADKFGDYGTVVLAIVKPSATALLKKDEATLDTFLMSCRVMGRGVECVFIDSVIRDLAGRGFKKLHASFIATAKNKPIENFLADHGFSAAKKDGADYSLDLVHYMKHPCEKVNKAIKISTNG